MHITLKQLRVLLAVADKGSFSGAAQAVALTQSAVSQSIRALEDELGLRLVDRNTRQVALTPAGAALAGPLRASLDGLEALLDQARLEGEHARGVVRVACTPAVPGTLVPRCLADAAQRYPDIQVQLREQTQAQALDGVRHGTLDFALVIGDDGLDDLAQTSVTQEAYVLVCRRDHPFARRRGIDLAQLRFERLILLDAAAGGRAPVDRLLAAQGVDVRAAQEVAQPSTALGMVAEHLGVALLPATGLPLPHGAALRAVPLAPALTRSVVLASRRSPALSVSARLVHGLFAEATAVARAPSAARAVTLLIPFPAQGPADGYGRAFARALSAQLQQEVVVKNTTGMGGMLGVHQLTRSLADGCTIGMAGTGATVFAPLFERPGLFDVFKDLRFLSGLARVPNILVVGSHVPARTLSALLAQARLRPGHWTIGAVGTGSNHVLALLLQAHAGITLGLQPYDGLLPALQDLARGQLDMVFGEAAGVLAAIRVGTAHPLFTADDRRARLLPEVPHAAEVGLPGVMAEGGYCLVAPASSPEPVLRRLADASAVVLNSPALAEEFAVQGGLPDPRSGAFYAAYVKAERSRWQQVMRRSAGGAAPSAATARD